MDWKVTREISELERQVWHFSMPGSLCINVASWELYQRPTTRHKMRLVKQYHRYDPAGRLGPNHASRQDVPLPHDVSLEIWNRATQNLRVEI